MNFSPLRFGPLRLLLLLSLLLAAGLAWMWFDEHAQMRSLVWVAPKPLAPDIKGAVAASQTSAVDPTPFASIVERPLFAPDRRPPPPPPAATLAPPPDPLANIQIHGIFSGVNAGILARVDGTLRRVKINENIGPWTLKSIDGRDVTFTQGPENRQIRLAYARLDTAVAPVAAAAGNPPAAQASVFGSPVPLDQKTQDETRERLRRRNELRASRGLPPLTE